MKQKKEISTTANGTSKCKNKTVSEQCNTLGMALSTTDIGLKEKPMGEVSYIQTITSSTVALKKTNSTVRALTG